MREKFNEEFLQTINEMEKLEIEYDKLKKATLSLKEEYAKTDNKAKCIYRIQKLQKMYEVVYLKFKELRKKTDKKEDA